ncbi:hypothetical protein Tco_0891156 [Tanacetum coccineum]|uniref:Uncharacterized protein n=1 Tax=Tanacetum coccineum TaxID=301880 RepID=A0ABQ5C848_9ASTR
MERPSKCEELERVVGRCNWLDMMIVYCQEFANEHRDFALRVNRLNGDMILACEDRGSKEWPLRDLEKEAREMAFKIDSFLLKLMDEEPSYIRDFRGDDRQRGCVIKCEDFVFVHNCYGDRISQKKKQLYDGKQNIVECVFKGGRDKGPTVKVVSTLVVHCEFKRRSQWQHYQYVMSCVGLLICQIGKRDSLCTVDLDVLVSIFVPGKMGEFMKESQGKDIPNLMKLQILGREFELRAQEKEVFIEKLKGNMKF